MSRLITSRLSWLMAAGMLCSGVAMSQAPAPCRIHDPELQARYTGGCKEGLADGYGEASGEARYQGEFRAGRKHGRGVKTWPTGDRYEGEFAADLKEGNGTYTWGKLTAWPGEKYTGEWRNDLRHGFGTYQWPDGERYEGPWTNDFVAGKATPRMIARARAYAEQVAAVSRPGVRVCRDMTIGIATRDRVRGTVVAADMETIAVRIDDPGRFENAVGDTRLTKGITVRDALTAWFPCN